jgi:hypothetical protein
MILYFVNLVILVPQVGQVARIMLRPFAVFSMVVWSSGTVFFSLHFTQNISANEYFPPLADSMSVSGCRGHKSLW